MSVLVYVNSLVVSDVIFWSYQQVKKIMDFIISTMKTIVHHTIIINRHRYESNH